MVDTWERGDPYERYMGRWSRRLAPTFLAWTRCSAGLSWLDVGCGTGALSTAIVEHCSPRWVAGVEPARGFLHTAQQNLAGRVMLAQGTATAIPLDASSVNSVVSGLVLNFVPDPRAAVSEMARVTTDGGSLGVYVWDYAGKMEFTRLFWDAVTRLDPNAEKLDEGHRFPLCQPEALRELFASAGLEAIEVDSIDLPTRFTDFDDYWQPFLGGQGPGPAYVMALEAAQRARLRDDLQNHLPTSADGSIALIARAWAIRATVKK